MEKEIGFDTDKYLEKQVEKLSQRLHRFERLYLEFGGKLILDLHAQRVLPGYRAGAKVELLKKLGKIDLFYCICADDISKGRIRGDSGLTYDLQIFKDIDGISKEGLQIKGVIISRFKEQTPAIQLQKKLKVFGIKSYFQYEIEGYPTNIEKILLGFKNQPFVKMDSNLIVVTGAGGGSGKMAFCLSQIFNERNKGIKSGFAKFETFPIWNLNINHPVNVAYEASTADMCDLNQIDPFHKKEYKEVSVNYNRDIENFLILKELMKSVTGEKYPFGYKSPTDMGVNMAKEGIINDKVCRNAGKQEIIRRYFRYHKEEIEGKGDKKTSQQIDLIMNKLKLKPTDRKVVLPARKAAKNIFCGAAIELPNGKIVTGKNSYVLHAESAAILNAIKIMANIPDKIDLISPSVLKEISEMKGNLLKKNSPSLTVNETLIALASCSVGNPSAKEALNKISELKDCEMHSTILPATGDEVGLRILKINLTTDAKKAFLKVI